MDGWNTSFLLGWPIIRCELLVSGRVTHNINSHFFVGVIREAWEGKHAFMSKRLGVEWVMLCK